VARPAKQDSTWQPMNANPHRSRFLSTKRSVTIFSVALCLAVAGATETVFAYRDHEMDTKARVGREFEVGASTIDRAPMTQETYVPRLVSRLGAYEAAQASPKQTLNPDYVFSANVTSAVGPIASAVASPINRSELPPDATSSLVAAPQGSSTASNALAAKATSAAPAEATAHGREARSPAVARVQCGSAVCPEGEACCNASCGTCAKAGDLCSQQVCGMSTMPTSVLCGSNTCNVGQSCCNASCGICARPGEQCDATKVCENSIQYPSSVSCGLSTCNAGLVCCNPSCGICARFGEPCSQNACD